MAACELPNLAGKGLSGHIFKFKSKKKTSDHRIFSGHQNVVIKMSHHMVPGTTFKHTNQSLPTAPKKIQIVKANATTVLARSLNTHSTNSKPCLSWILDEPFGQQLQPLIRFNTPISPKFVIRTALPLPTIPPVFLRVLRWRLVKWRASTGPWLGQLLWPKKQKQEKIRDLTSLVQWLLLIQIILNRFEHHLLIPLKFSILKTE